MVNGIPEVLKLNREIQDVDFYIKAEYVFCGLLAQYQILNGDAIIVKQELIRFQNIARMGGTQICDNVYKPDTIPCKLYDII